MLFKDEYKKNNDDIVLNDFAREAILNSMKKAQDKPCITNDLVYYKKKNVKTYIAIAAVIAVALSSMTIFATDMWSEKLKGYFDWMNKNYDNYYGYEHTADLKSDNFLTYEQIAELGQEINVSGKVNDITITVKRIIFDNACFFADINLTAPKDIELSIDGCDDNIISVAPVIAGKNIFGNTGTYSDWKFEKISTDNANENTWNIYVRYLYAAVPDLNGMENAYIAFPGIPTKDHKEFRLMLPNDITSNVASKSSDDDNVVITPLSVLCKGDLVKDSENSYGHYCRIVFKDGTDITIRDYSRGVNNDNVSIISYEFPNPINLENVKQVIIDGKFIKFK